MAKNFKARFELEHNLAQAQSQMSQAINRLQSDFENLGKRGSSMQMNKSLQAASELLTDLEKKSKKAAKAAADGGQESYHQWRRLQTQLEQFSRVINKTDRDFKQLATSSKNLGQEIRDSVGKGKQSFAQGTANLIRETKGELHQLNQIVKSGLESDEKLLNAHLVKMRQRMGQARGLITRSQGKKTPEEIQNYIDSLRLLEREYEASLRRRDEITRRSANNTIRIQEEAAKRSLQLLNTNYSTAMGGRLQSVLSGNVGNFRTAAEARNARNELIELMRYGPRDYATAQQMGFQDPMAMRLAGRSALQQLRDQEKQLELSAGRGRIGNLIHRLTGGRSEGFGAGRQLGGLNHRITNVAQLMGTSLYGLGAFGAGTAFIRGTVGSAMESEQMKTTLAGIINTYQQFTDESGKAVSAQENFNRSMARSEVLYKRIRKEAAESILTGKELTSYYLGAASMGMRNGLNEDQVLRVSERLGTLGKAMGLRETDTQQDIRGLLQLGGRVDSTNKTAQVLGITGKERDLMLSQGADTFMTYFEEKFKGLNPALDKFANSFMSKWDVFIDKLQQTGISIGERLIPALTPMVENLTKTIDGWVSSGKAEQFASSIGDLLRNVTGHFAGFVGWLSQWATSGLNIALMGVIGVFASFTTRLVAQTALANPAVSGFLSVLGALVAGIIMYRNHLQKEEEQRSMDANSFLSGTITPGAMRETAASSFNNRYTDVGSFVKGTDAGLVDQHGGFSTWSEGKKAFATYQRASKDYLKAKNNALLELNQELGPGNAITMAQFEKITGGNANQGAYIAGSVSDTITGLFGDRVSQAVNKLRRTEGSAFNYFGSKQTSFSGLDPNIVKAASAYAKAGGTERTKYDQSRMDSLVAHLNQKGFKVSYGTLQAIYGMDTMKPMDRQRLLLGVPNIDKIKAEADKWFSGSNLIPQVPLSTDTPGKPKRPIQATIDKDVSDLTGLEEGLGDIDLLREELEISRSARQDQLSRLRGSGAIDQMRNLVGYQSTNSNNILSQEYAKIDKIYQISVARAKDKIGKLEIPDPALSGRIGKNGEIPPVSMTRAVEQMSDNKQAFANAMAKAERVRQVAKAKALREHNDRLKDSQTILQDEIRDEATLFRRNDLVSDQLGVSRAIRNASGGPLTARMAAVDAQAALDIRSAFLEVSPTGSPWGVIGASPQQRRALNLKIQGIREDAELKKREISASAAEVERQAINSTDVSVMRRTMDFYNQSRSVSNMSALDARVSGLQFANTQYQDEIGLQYGMLGKLDPTASNYQDRKTEIEREIKSRYDLIASNERLIAAIGSEARFKEFQSSQSLGQMRDYAMGSALSIPATGTESIIQNAMARLDSMSDSNLEAKAVSDGIVTSGEKVSRQTILNRYQTRLYSGAKAGFAGEALRGALSSGTVDAYSALLSGSDPLKAFSGSLSPLNEDRRRAILQEFMRGKGGFRDPKTGKFNQQAMYGAGADLISGYLVGQMDPNSYASVGGDVGGVLGGTVSALGPWGSAVGTLIGGLFGGLFKQKKKDPAAEAYKRNVAKWLSNIDRNTRQVSDYYQTRVRTFNVESMYLGGRGLGFSDSVGAS